MGSRFSPGTESPHTYSLPETPDYSASPSQHHSRSGSPSRSTKPKKRVEWHLDEDDTQDEEQDPPSRRSDDDARHKLVDEETGEPLGREITNAELRREMHRIFSESSLSGQSDAEQEPKDARRPSYNESTSNHRSEGPSSGSKEGSHGPSTHATPKSVLRGTATPPTKESPDENSSNGLGDSGGRKSRSAADAHARAQQMADSLGDEAEVSHSSTAGNLFSTAQKKKKKQKSRKNPRLYHEGDPLRSGYGTPEEEGGTDQPPRYMTMGLSAVNMLNQINKVRSNYRRSSAEDGLSSRASSRTSSPNSSPRHSIFSKSPRDSRRGSTTSLVDLLHSSSAHLGSIAGVGVGKSLIGQAQAGRSDRMANRPSYSRTSSTGIIDSISKPWKGPSDREIHIKRHVQETVFRQRYLLKLCRALLEYGAPSHRLEEYMKMSARVLEIEAQFLYIPGCMIISFDDSRTHTTEVRLVRVSQGVDLGKLRDAHDVYKDVVHDEIGVEEATDRLVEILERKPKFSKVWDVIMFGFASASVAPFAFYGRWIDLPFCFFLGALLGFLRIVVAPSSELYTNIFEIFAVVLTSFLARAFGSIRNGELFCFSAMAQSSLALILPGYTVLRGALELQSKSLVAGSVNVVYAIIFSLFIGFGLTLGSVIYGAMDHNATSATNCPNPLSSNWDFMFVPIFAFCLAFVNKAKWRDMPVMVIVAFIGWIISHYTSQHVAQNIQITNTLAALGIGVTANLYSRVGRRCEEYIGHTFAFIWKKVYELLPIKKTTKENTTPSSLEKQVSPSEDAESTATNHNPNLFRRSVNSVQRLHRRIVGSERPNVSPENGSNDDTMTDEGTDADPSKKRKVKRTQYALAASAMLPAIFVQVPSGLSVSGNLVAGIQSADQIANNNTAGGISSGSVLNGERTGANVSGDVTFGVAYSVVQISIGITVGLFLATLCVYPFGKGGSWSKGMRSGIFSF